MAWNKGFGSGGWDGSQNSIGGVSAVNPQAQGNYQQYQDAAFRNAKDRLDPMMQRQQSQWAQKMQNQGLPTGGEGFSNSMRDLMDYQNSAYNNAAFDAMQFGAQMQNQDFQQDLARSSLSNALLRSKWDTGLGYYNTDKNFELGMNRLDEDARQFDDTTDFNYWDRENAYRMGYDKMDRDDVRWMSEFDRQLWQDQIANNRWSDSMSQWALNPYAPGGPGTAGMGMNQANNMGIYGRGMDNYGNWWQDLMNLFGGAEGLFGGD